MVPARIIERKRNGEELAPSELESFLAAYLDDLDRKVAGAAWAAWTNRQDARLSVARSESRIGVNRRERRPDGQIVLGQNPAGSCDRELLVGRLDTADGAPLATLVPEPLTAVDGPFYRRPAPSAGGTHLAAQRTGDVWLLQLGAPIGGGQP